MVEPREVHLVDASPYVFRAYFALPASITDREGRPANAVYGFARFLLEYLEKVAPTHGAVAFDGSLTTSFRNELYPGYKAGRELPPAELEAQLDACREVAGALGWTTWTSERFEADDLVATACAQLVAAGHRVVVVSSDKDLAQLVSDRVVLHDWARGVRYGPAEVRAKLGVDPAQVADFLGLAGDPVDDIPGVRGVGKKTAAALLAAVGSLDAALADPERVAALPLRGARSLARKLGAEREAALLSRELATVSTAAPVRARLAELALRGPDRRSAAALFERLGFDGLRRTVAEEKA